MTEQEMIEIVRARCNLVETGVEKLLEAVFGPGHKFVLILSPSEYEYKAGAIITNVELGEHCEAILHTAYHRDKNANIFQTAFGNPTH